MNKTISHYVPVLTSPAGSCLTMANWQASGVQFASFDLASLLVKPGWDVLHKLSHLSTYVACPGRLILNMTMLTLRKEGYYRIHSPYDGQKLSFTLSDLLSLVIQLQPDMLILPQGVSPECVEFCRLLPESVLLIASVADVHKGKFCDRACGLYFSYKKQSDLTDVLLKHVAQYPGLPWYVAGDLDFPLMRRLAAEGVSWVETDIPARDACAGFVYSSEGVLALQSTHFAMQHELIDASCACPTCGQGLTRAYLHHLLANTPLLCQRFLLQHNVFYTTHSFTLD